jgi:hypothetical protein
VYQTAMIMLDACAPPYLIAYAAHIGHYYTRYGAKCWALIYQMETRFRRETMERGRRQASDDLDEAIAAGRSHPFDPTRPWEYIFKMATDGGASEAKYWHVNVEEPCLLIIAGRYNAAEFVDGDARICANGSAHIATHGSPGMSLAVEAGNRGNGKSSSSTQHPPKRQKSPPANRPPKRQDNKTSEAHKKQKQHNVVGGKFTTNRQGNVLCLAFNSGAGCPGAKRGNPICPRENMCRHLCSLCLSSSHGAHECKAPAKTTK